MAKKGQENKQRYPKHYTENYRSTQGELGCSWRVGSSCSI